MRSTGFLVGLVAVGFGLSCQGKLVPLSAQAGSTVVIPLVGDPAAGAVGYGGTVEEDYQRGTLVYKLGGPTGPELVTRLSSLAMASPTAEVVEASIAPKRQVVSLVDIPANAPLGTHTLHVVRRRIEAGVPVDYAGPSYAGTLTILPNSLTFDVGGSPFTSIGAATPFQQWTCFPSCSWKNVTSNIPLVIPRPELRITLGALIHAVELRVDYDPDVIDVVDAFEPASSFVNHLATVWWTDDGVGTARLSAVAATTSFRTLSLVFSLDFGDSAILDPADVDVTIEGAWGETGTPVATSVSSKTIF